MASAEITNLSQLSTGHGEIVFDNKGHTVVNNRAYRRQFKELWRAVREDKDTTHYYTKQTRRKLGKKFCRRDNKMERQNRKSGRRLNGTR